MKWVHAGLIFSNEEIEYAKKHLTEQPQKVAYNQLKIIADSAFSYKPKPVKGMLSIPRFYVDRAGWRKASYELETSAKMMISCANIYRITDEQKYAEKAIKIANAWTDSITEYATKQAQYEANWHLQTMATACELIHTYFKKDIKDFLKWDYSQCLKLERLNKESNNLLYWLAAHMITAAVTNEDKQLFDRACEIYKNAIKEDIAQDGHMPKETARGYRGIHYTFFAIDPLIFIAEIAKHQGYDLFSYSHKNKSLLTAIKYVLLFIKNPETWPWSKDKQDFSVFPRIHSGWCEIAYREWKLKELKDFLDKNRPLFDARTGGAQTLVHGFQ